MKDEFLATLSHELRTPLNAILGWAHLLDRASATTPTHRARHARRSATTRMAQSQLIADILDVSRIIGGKLRLNLAPVELATVIEAALDSVQPAAEAKGIAIDDDARRRRRRSSATSDRLQQVMWNLLSNAVKFTPQRRPRRACGCERAGGDVVIAVADTGRASSRTSCRTCSIGSRRPTARDAAPRRARARHGDRAPPRRAARRHRVGGERGPESRCGLHRCPARGDEAGYRF